MKYASVQAWMYHQFTTVPPWAASVAMRREARGWQGGRFPSKLGIGPRGQHFLVSHSTPAGRKGEPFIDSQRGPDPPPGAGGPRPPPLARVRDPYPSACIRGQASVCSRALPFVLSLCACDDAQAYQTARCPGLAKCHRAP